MVRYRKINIYGLRYVVELMKSDIKDLGLEVGDYVDIDEMVIKKKEKEIVTAEDVDGFFKDLIWEDKK